MERRVFRSANSAGRTRPTCNTATDVWPTNYLARRGPIRSSLGDLYPSKRIRTALKSVYRYNWAPNVAAQNHGPSAAALVRPAGRRRAIHVHVAQRRPHGRAGAVSRRSLDRHRIPGRLGLLHRGLIREGFEHHSRHRRSLRRPHGTTPGTKSSAATITRGRWPRGAA